jgi:purine nucleosidase
VIAYLLKPGLYGGRHCNVMVDATNELTLGMTVVDWWGVTDRPRNAFYIRDVDDEAFFDLLIERVARLP